jgi:transcriptional antiterminator NusG
MKEKFAQKIMCEKFVFCICCKESKENDVELFLKQMGYNVISALAERTIIVNGKIENVLRSVIPGYVFFESENLLDIFTWKEICGMEYIFFPLKYADNEKGLRGNDLVFVNWLKRNNGLLKISKVIEIGKKIKVLEGPLKDYEGKIIKIRRRQKCVAIKLEGEGIENIVWLSYEYREPLKTVN